MKNDSSNLTTADEAITFLVKQGIFDFFDTRCRRPDPFLMASD